VRPPGTRAPALTRQAKRQPPAGRGSVCRMRPPARLCVALSALIVATSVPTSPVVTAGPDATAIQGRQADRPSRSWRRASSTHFVAVGDASETALFEALTELEVFRAALLGLAPVLPTPDFSRQAPLLIVFRSEGVFNPFKPIDRNGRRRNNVGGYYMRDLSGGYMVTYASGPRLGNQLSTVLHEYAHDIFLATLGPHMPVWLNEGLAELSGSVGAAGTSLVTDRYLGRPIDQWVHALRSGSGPSVAQLLETDAFELQAMSANAATFFYAKSWALVHYLLLQRPDRTPDDVPALLAALAKGRPAAEAFEAAFRVDLSTIDATIARYMRQLTFPAIRIPDLTESSRTVTAEVMRESEVDLLRGELFFRLPDTERAEEMLTRAFALAPDVPDTRLALARLRLLEHRPAEVLDLLRPIAKDASTPALALITLGRAQQHLGQFDEAFHTFTAATQLDAPDAQRAEAWLGRSLAALSAGMRAEADESMAALQRISPGYSPYFARARGLWAAGHDALAIDDARRVVESQGANETNRSYGAFVGVLAARRLGQPALANELLTQAEPYITSEWTQTVLSYLRGDLTDRQLLSRANGRGDETEAHAYIGLMASLEGRLDEARTRLRWVRDRGSRTFAEYEMASVELARIDTPRD
jgi:tetratricopeptide (TPR) repeat protein